MDREPRIGVLAAQGAFREHAQTLRRLGAEVVEVRLPDQLVGLDGLVIPGGESTAMLRGMERDRLEEPLADFVRSGRPVLGTCAGAILLARRVLNPPQRSFGTLDIDVERNGYGTQLDSFSAPLEAAGPLAGLLGVFIRAPRIRRVGPDVTVLARERAEPVLVRHGPIWAATFHPELTDDSRIHERFLELVEEVAGVRT